RPFAPDPARSAMWNRGKYLVDGAGHCGACHTPRNALGAEKGGLAYLSGGEAEGWVAPPLVASPAAPVPWTEGALFDYLRTGFSGLSGVAWLTLVLSPISGRTPKCPTPPDSA
ncbi:cytochrome c, partial [Burkholderia cenocepacia]|nr:cytochrome c [Burkholderia cenocepacia]